MIPVQKENTVTVLSHSYSPQLLIGEQVFDLLEKKEFLDDWDELYQNCKWSTLFQSRSFVSSWYKIYKDQYLPIVALTYSNNRLAGLLCMTITLPDQHLDLSQISGKIVGAGHYEAEYQSWLATRESSDEFIQKGLKLLNTAFPRCDIFFRYLIPQVPIAWLANGDWTRKTTIQAYRRPYVYMGAPDIENLFRKKEFKNKLNRLNRLGELVFEQITDINDFTEVLPVLIEQYEFRQRAMYNKSHFYGSPEKAEFLKALFEKGLLHTTVLRIDRQIVASILGLKENNWYHLGAINTHSPIYGNHSPGFVHFILLCQLLSEDKNNLFDLTPGGDAYKERMANGDDFVNELCISHSSFFQKRQQLKYKVHHYLMKFKIRPMSMQLSLKKRKYDVNHWLKTLKSKGLKQTISNWKSKKNNKDGQLFILNSRPEQSPHEIHFDQLTALMNYEENQSGTSEWDFLNDAMQNFDNEFHAVTIVNDNILLCLAWMVEPLRWEKVFNQELPENQKYPVITGISYHSLISDKLDHYILSIAEFIKKRHKSPKVYLNISTQDNPVLYQLISNELIEA